MIDIENISYYIDMYKNWCKEEQSQEKSVAIVYVSAYGYTKSLAENIAKGIKEEGIADVQLFDLVYDDRISQ